MEAQCRLCLADIPHGYDHMFEEPEKPVRLDTTALDTAIAAKKARQKPALNASGIIVTIFLIFIINAAIFIGWLILCAALQSAYTTCPQPTCKHPEYEI